MAERKLPAPRPAPGAAGSVLPPLAAGVTAFAVLLYAVEHVVALGPVDTVAGWLLAPMNCWLAAVGAVWAARSAADDPVVRRFWYRIAVSCVGGGAGSLGKVWTDGSSNLHQPAWVYGIYAGTGMFLLLALLLLPVPRRPRAGWLTVALDIGIVAIAGGLLAWFLGVHAADPLRTASGSMMPLMTLILVGCIGLIAVMKVAIAGTASVHPGAVHILGGTAIAAGVAGGALSVLALRTNVSGALVVFAMTGYGFVLAADRQRRASLGLLRPRGGRRGFSLLPYATIGIVDLLLVISEVTDPHEQGFLALGSVALTGLVIARQLVALRDNTRLLTRLDTSLAEVGRHEHRFRSLLQHSPDVVAVTDRTGRVQYASPGIAAVLHNTPEEVVGQFIGHRTHPEDLPVLAAQARRMMAAPGTPVTCQARLSRPDGSWRWLEIVSTNLLRDPEMRGVVSNVRDITETRRYQDELAYQASHDELTGLVNRTLFVRDTDAALTAGDPRRTAVALVDLDDFKTINDRLGHTVGDALLRAVGRRLQAGVRGRDTVARLGGDEFALLLRDVDPAERMVYAQRVVEELSVPVRAAGHDLLVRASVGVAPGTPGADAGELLRRADVAMYAAKGLGRGRCMEFTSTMDAQAREHARLAADLSVAVDRGEVHLRYQPIVALPSGSLAGVEALIRWTHPIRGAVSPVEFIPVAEHTGLIVPLGSWVLHEACRQAASWLRRYGPAAPDRISVNVSARQLIEPDFPATVEAALATSGLPAERLTAEITETAVFDGGPALEAVQAMRALGVRVALDDFGTGHSSLGLLRTCPIDVLKVDKSFVDGVAQSLEQEAIVTSVRQIGTAMRLQVVAEGVETAVQADRLHVLGYRFAQGFHFARPLSTTEIEARLAQAMIAAAA